MPFRESLQNPYATGLRRIIRDIRNVAIADIRDITIRDITDITDIVITDITDIALATHVRNVRIVPRVRLVAILDTYAICKSIARPPAEDYVLVDTIDVGLAA